MATLTADELDDIRLVTGADNVAVITDELIQSLYDSAYTTAPDVSLAEPYTYIAVIRRLLGYYAKQVTRITDHGDKEMISDKFKQTKELLKLWGTWTGLTDANGNPLRPLTSGTLSLGIDATEDNMDEWTA